MYDGKIFERNKNVGLFKQKYTVINTGKKLEWYRRI